MAFACRGPPTREAIRNGRGEDDKFVNYPNKVTTGTCHCCTVVGGYSTPSLHCPPAPFTTLAWFGEATRMYGTRRTKPQLVHSFRSLDMLLQHFVGVACHSRHRPDIGATTIGVSRDQQRSNRLLSLASAADRWVGGLAMLKQTASDTGMLRKASKKATTWSGVKGDFITINKGLESASDTVGKSHANGTR